MTDYKYQICAFADEAGATPAEQIDAMRANGVTLLEMRSVNGKNVTTLTDDEVRDFRAQLDDAGIGVWAIGSPCGKHPLSEPFGPQLDTLRRTIDIARLAGASRIRMFSFYGYDGSAAARDEVMDRLNRYVEAAAGCATKTKREFTATPPTAATTFCAASRRWAACSTQRTSCNATRTPSPRGNCCTTALTISTSKTSVRTVRLSPPGWAPVTCRSC